MKVCILGGDGYLGWPTAMYLSARGHEVTVVDNMAKRQWEAAMDVYPLLQPPDLQQRVNTWQALTGRRVNYVFGDIAVDAEVTKELFAAMQPDAVVHYAEQPSAPYSMMSQEAGIYTQNNNINGTLNVIFAIRDFCPNAHLIKLGTMGSYGTPNIDIEEGWIEIRHKGRKDYMLYPKSPHSLYHLSKVHDSHNLEFACRIWQLRVTDLHQGTVYGIQTDETCIDPALITSFHYDSIFGTVINRFLAQAAAGLPLTVYGSGRQVRCFLNLRDTLQSVELAAKHPAAPGAYRVFNQFTEQFSLADLARRVQAVALQRGIRTHIINLDNPRTEAEDHYYRVSNTNLTSLGLQPHLLDDVTLDEMLGHILTHRGTVRHNQILPTITWEKGCKQRMRQADSNRMGGHL